MYEEKVKTTIMTKIETEYAEKRNDTIFLEALIKELEEQFKIELRKKAILKNQMDQAYLRGVAAISMEALKMSQSTLNGKLLFAHDY